MQLFIFLQVILLMLMTLHDWVDLPPLTNIKPLSKEHSIKNRLFGTIINTLFVLIPLLITIICAPAIPRQEVYAIRGFYSGLTIGTLLAWWVPYIFGPYSKQHKLGFQEYEATHHFLPAIKDHIIPNTLHVILHVLIWSCFIIAWSL